MMTAEEARKTAEEVGEYNMLYNSVCNLIINAANQGHFAVDTNRAYDEAVYGAAQRISEKLGALGYRVDIFVPTCKERPGQKMSLRVSWF